MNKILSLAIVFVLVFSVLILAQDSEISQLVNPGITPDSFLYGVDLALENIGLALTFNSNVKIEKKLRNAEERLSEVRAMALENKIEEMAEAKEKLEEVSKDIKEDLDGIIGEDSKEELREIIKLEQKIGDLDDKVDEVEKEIKIKIKIKGDLTQEQMDLIIQLINSFEGKVGELDIKIKVKKGEIKIKVKEETGRDADEVEDELEEEEEIEGEEEIEVEIEDGRAEVDLEYGSIDEKFILETTDQEEILNEIALRLEVSVEDIRDIVKFDIEEDEEDEENEDDNEEEED